MSDISPELVERMTQLVRVMAKGHILKSAAFDEAYEIAAALPEPVDPDLIEARKMAADQSGGAQYFLSGACDDWSNVRLALSAIKRGRELALRQAS